MSKGEDKCENNYIKRFLENIYTLDDFDRFIQAVRENKDAIDSHAIDLWQKALRLPSPTQEDKDLSFSEIQLILNEKAKNTLRKKVLKIASVAASIIVIMGLLYSAFKGLTLQEKYDPVYVEIMTQTGETKTIVLPDGSTVTLNSCSRILYPEEFEKGQRLIELTGEAYFQVVKNEKMPFMVKTTHFNVKVLGTEFDIKSYQDSKIFSVSVQNGKVQVDMPEAMMCLVDSEIVRFDTQDQTFSKEKNEQKTGVWRSGRLQFNKTPIKDVGNELERIFNYKVHFKEGQTFDNLITGEHSSQDLESILASIESVTGVHCSVNETDKVILFYKE